MLDAYNARTTGAKVNYQGRILISDRAHVLFDFHKIIDGKKEEVLPFLFLPFPFFFPFISFPSFPFLSYPFLSFLTFPFFSFPSFLSLFIQFHSFPLPCKSFPFLSSSFLSFPFLSSPFLFFLFHFFYFPCPFRSCAR